MSAEDDKAKDKPKRPPADEGEYLVRCPACRRFFSRYEIDPEAAAKVCPRCGEPLDEVPSA